MGLDDGWVDADGGRGDGLSLGESRERGERWDREAGLGEVLEESGFLGGGGEGYLGNISGTVDGLGVFNDDGSVEGVQVVDLLGDLVGDVLESGEIGQTGQTGESFGRLGDLDGLVDVDVLLMVLLLLGAEGSRLEGLGLERLGLESLLLESWSLRLLLLDDLLHWRLGNVLEGRGRVLVDDLLHWRLGKVLEGWGRVLVHDLLHWRLGNVLESRGLGLAMLDDLLHWRLCNVLEGRARLMLNDLLLGNVLEGLLGLVLNNLDDLIHWRLGNVLDRLDDLGCLNTDDLSRLETRLGLKIVGEERINRLDGRGRLRNDFGGLGH